MPDWNAGIAGLRDGIGLGLQIDRHMQAKEDREYQRRRQEQEDAYIRQQRERENAYLTKKRGWEEDEYNYGLQQRKKQEIGRGLGVLGQALGSGNYKLAKTEYKRLKDMGLDPDNYESLESTFGNFSAFDEAMRNKQPEVALEYYNKIYHKENNKGLTPDELRAGVHKKAIGLDAGPENSVVIKYGVFDKDGNMIRQGHETNNRGSNDEFVKTRKLDEIFDQIFADRSIIESVRLGMTRNGVQPAKKESPNLQQYFDQQGREVRGFFNPETGAFQQVGGAKALTNGGRGTRSSELQEIDYVFNFLKKQNPNVPEHLLKQQAWQQVNQARSKGMLDWRFKLVETRTQQLMKANELALSNATQEERDAIIARIDQQAQAYADNRLGSMGSDGFGLQGFNGGGVGTQQSIISQQSIKPKSLLDRIESDIDGSGVNYNNTNGARQILSEIRTRLNQGNIPPQDANVLRSQIERITGKLANVSRAKIEASGRANQEGNPAQIAGGISELNKRHRDIMTNGETVGMLSQLANKVREQGNQNAAYLLQGVSSNLTQSDARGRGGRSFSEEDIKGKEISLVDAAKVHDALRQAEVGASPEIQAIIDNIKQQIPDLGERQRPTGARGRISYD